MEVTLRAQPRAGAGKGAARQARMAGSVPAVLYGRGIEPLSLTVDARAMGHVLHTEAGANVLVNLEIEGGRRYLTMVREVQRHPVRGTLTHVDFVNTARDVKTHADVPVAVVGASRGVREGGVVEHHLWQLKVEALPADIPAHVEVDITDLGVGEHLRVSDVTPPPGVEIHDDPDEIILSIIEPQAMRAAEAGEAAAEAAVAAVEGGTAAAE
ncbi:MAG TPA: 50S ribosomal protein L25 [Actinomycetota bacterium]|nr:50S ribosomal protein L25 [Actinomycetota bacterium]